MNEPTKTLLCDLALASAAAIAAGTLVACSFCPLLSWWADRRIGRAGPSPAPGPVGGEDLDRQPDVGSNTTALSPEDETAAAVERLIALHRRVP